MTDLAKSAERFVLGSQSSWSELVDIALALKPKQLNRGAERLSKLAGINPKTTMQKFNAIRLAAQENTAADIKAAGQAKTLGTYVKAKNGARTDKQVVLSWKVAPELRKSAHEQMLRVGKILNFTTSNEYIAWWNAQLETTTDEEIRHSAGECK